MLLAGEQSLVVGHVTTRLDARLPHDGHVRELHGEEGVAHVPAWRLEIPLGAEGDQRIQILSREHHVPILVAGEGLPLEVGVEQVLAQLGADVLEEVPQAAEDGIVAQDRVLILATVHPVEVGEHQGRHGEHDEEHREDHENQDVAQCAQGHVVPPSRSPSCGLVTTRRYGILRRDGVRGIAVDRPRRGHAVSPGRPSHSEEP